MTISTPSSFGELNRWFHAGWGGALLAVGVVAVLLCLAAANVVVRANWNEVEDGVLWIERSQGLVAEAVAPDTAAAISGLLRGDVLLAIDGEAVSTREDVLDRLHASEKATQLSYTVLRLGTQEIRELTLQPAPSSALPVYFVLVAVGVFALLIGVSVRVRRPGHQATLHFFWLSVAFFGVFTFSFSGRLDRLDWIFFWADTVSTVLLAPLFIHFALVFPERTPGRVRSKCGWWFVPMIYLPAALLWIAEIAAVRGSAQGVAFTTTINVVWRLEMAYLATCVIGGLAIMIKALQRVRSVTARRQLRWIVSGAVLGGLPFTVGYALPWSLGFDPVARLDVTALPLGLIPLAFASAIVRYRLHDVEVIVKRGLGYTAVVASMVAIYLVFEKLVSEVFLEESDGHNSIIALLATAVVALLAAPVKNTIQTMLDRAYYRDRYDYRKALVGFARDLNSDLDLDRLTDRLVTRVTETLVVDQMVLFQAALGTEGKTDAFVPLNWTGFESTPPRITETSKLSTRMRGRQTVVFDASLRQSAEQDDELVFWRENGLRYFIPCVAKEGTIAVMALGRKGSGEPLSSEDMALLAAVAGQVATALENGRLYGRLQLKAKELDRMHQFSENIIESLSDGLVVLDLDDRVVRWNAGMERLYGLSRDAAVGQQLATLFDRSFSLQMQHARENTPNGAVCSRVPLLSRHHDGDSQARQLLVNVATAPLLTPAGNVSGMMIIIEDITQRIQLEEQLQISEKMASIGLLAAGVAHEVNTPLTGISSFTQILLESAEPNDPKTKILEKIERQTFRAAKIVNGLLNLARPGRSDVSGSVDLNVVVNDVLALLEHQLTAGSVKVRREFSTEPVMVEGVEFKLQQVFLNLFLNARDAMPTGGWLGIRTRTDGEAVVVEVSDTGAGIAPESLSRIYDPFFTTKAPGQGTGLGLSITYAVIQEHHGAVKCDSEPGQGTRFTLTLPLTLVARAHAQTTAAV
jgi:PAS domain S-box-containing protein